VALFSMSGPALVLKQFQIGEPASDTVLHIVARQPGLMSFFLTLFGLDTETSLKVDRRSVTFSGSSLFGQMHITVPLTAVSATICGYTKSLGKLLMGIGCLIGYGFLYLQAGGSEYELGQTSGLRMVAFIVGMAFLVAYWLSRRLVVSVQAGDVTLGLVFKRSLIENVDVDFPKAQQAIERVNAALLRAQQGSATASSARV